MFCLEGCPPNPGLHATWLIGALFEFFRPHFGLLLGKCARAAAAKRVKPTVMPPTDKAYWSYSVCHLCFGQQWFHAIEGRSKIRDSGKFRRRLRRCVVFGGIEPLRLVRQRCRRIEGVGVAERGSGQLAGRQPG